MKLLPRLALAALAGGAAVFGMAPFDCWPLLLAALGVFAWAVDGTADRPRPKRTAALTGWAFGFAYFAGGFYWVGEAFYVDPATIWMMPFAVTLLPAGMALYYALAAAAARAFPQRGAAFALVFAAVFAATEFLRGWLFTGFPWNLFGTSFIGSGFDQGAAVTGLYGLTLAALIAGFGLYPLLAVRGWRRAIPLGFGLLLLGGSYAYGQLREPTPAPTGTHLRIVQPDNPQSEKALPDYRRRLWQRLMALTLEPGAQSVDIFVWPEGVTPFLMEETPEALEVIGQALEPRQILIAGSVRRQQFTGGTRYYNSLFVVDGAGQIAAAYDKAHLVPFGEYMPFPEAFRALGIASLNARVADAFTPGPGPQTWKIGDLPAFSALICYEALFPAAVVGADQPRPAWLANITDDSWFGTQTGPWQHLTNARFRAIEEGLPLIRAATTGVSAVIDSDGRLVIASGLGEAVKLDAALPGARPPTPFSRYGHSGFWLLLALALALGLSLTERPFSVKDLKKI